MPEKRAAMPFQSTVADELDAKIVAGRRKAGERLVELD